MNRLTQTFLIFASTVLLTTEGGIVVPFSSWDHTEVSVCFASARQKDRSRMAEIIREEMMVKPRLQDFTTQERLWVRSIVEQEFAPEKTGIHFVGFSDCQDSRPADVWIYVGANQEGTGSASAGKATLGQGTVLDGYRNATDRRDGSKVFLIAHHRSNRKLKPEAVFLARRSERAPSKLDRETEFKMKALHEFTHVAGMVHEHERFEAHRDGNCSLSGEKVSANKVGETRFTSVYDPGSFTNYCYTRSIQSHSGLHYEVALPGKNPRSLPSNGLPILVWPGVNHADTERILYQEKKSDRIEFKIRLGLSRADRHALLCLYTPDALKDTDRCGETHRVQ